MIQVRFRCTPRGGDFIFGLGALLRLFDHLRQTLQQMVNTFEITPNPLFSRCKSVPGMPAARVAPCQRRVAFKDDHMTFHPTFSQFCSKVFCKFFRMLQMRYYLSSCRDLGEAVFRQIKSSECPDQPEFEALSLFLWNFSGVGHTLDLYSRELSRSSYLVPELGHANLSTDRRSYEPFRP